MNNVLEDMALQLAKQRANQFLKDKFLFGLHDTEDKKLINLIDRAIDYLNHCKKEIEEEDGTEKKRYNLDLEVFEVNDN